LGIDVAELVGGGLALGTANVLHSKDDLPLEVRDVDGIEIDEAESADAGGGEVERQRRAESAGADNQHLRALEPLLPVETDLGHDDVARIAREFGLGELDVG